MIPAIIITILILLNGFFVAAEFAIVGAQKALIEKIADENKMAARINKILRSPTLLDQYVATAQIGITFASLGLGMYGEHVLAEYLYHKLENWYASHGLATTLSIIILTYFHIVIGEMVPKSLALTNAGKLVFIITPILLLFQKIFYPLVLGLNMIGNFLLHLIGIRREKVNPESFYTTEEIKYIVEESKEKGLIGNETARMFERLVEFDDIQAEDIVVPRKHIKGIEEGAPFETIMGMVKEFPHIRYPVYRNDMDHIIGFVHSKDLLKLIIKQQPLTGEYIRKIYYIPGSANLNNVFRTMRKTRTQMVVIVDEYGGTEGMISLEDIFEEIIGEIEE